MKLLSNNEVINHKTEISNAIELAEEITTFVISKDLIKTYQK